MTETAIDPPTGPVQDEPPLKRVMGTRLLLLFIVGDILGTGVYALTGDIAAEVGGAAWAPFLVAFAVATVTACSYLELVTKYPHAGGAASYIHRAWGIQFLTFLICFAVMSSGITSASTASRAFAANLIAGIDVGWGSNAVLLLALAFMALVAVINFRGVSESVKANVVLTLVELTGLVIVILIGAWALAGGEGDFSRITVFETSEERSAFVAVTAATTLAFFAMVGFEDSVNMAEETREPSRIFPKVMLTGLTVTGIIYVLISISVVALVPIGQLAETDTPLLDAVEKGAPGLALENIYPFIAMFAVANSALINMLMASRLLYGMGKQRVLPRQFARVQPLRRTPWVSILVTTVLAFGLITYVSKTSEDAIATLGGTTSLLLLAVFTVVNIVVLVLRRDPVDHDHFRTPTALPVIGALACAYLVTPLAGRDNEQYVVAGLVLVLGVVLWAINRLFTGSSQGAGTGAGAARG